MFEIAAAEPCDIEIGLLVMRRGGNTVDAAVTCAFVQGVVDPQLRGLGGCGFCLGVRTTRSDSRI